SSKEKTRFESSFMLVMAVGPRADDLLHRAVAAVDEDDLATDEVRRQRRRRAFIARHEAKLPCKRSMRAPKVSVAYAAPERTSAPDDEPNWSRSSWRLPSGTAATHHDPDAGSAARPARHGRRQDGARPLAPAGPGNPGPCVSCHHPRTSGA